MKQIVLIIGLLLSPFFVRSQEIRPITKEEAINMAKLNSTSLKISQQEVLAAKGDLNSTNAIFLPNITASHTGIATTNPLMAFGSKLNQGILTSADFDPTLLNNPPQVKNFATKLEVQQPLINLDGVYQRKAAKAKFNATAMQSKRKEDHLLLEIEKAYMQLQLAYKTVKVMEKTLETAMANKTIVVNNLNQGYAQKVDVLEMEVHVSEIQNHLQTTKSNVRNASDYLLFLTNEKGTAVLQPKDSLTIAPIPMDADGTLSKKRSDIKAMEYGTQAREKMFKADKMSFLPRLNAFGSYELYDNQIFQTNANGYLYGAQLSWNILDGTKRFGKAQKSKAEYEKSKLEYEHYLSKSQLDLNKAKRSFLDARNKLKLSELAMEQSRESLRIRTNRFKEGLEKPSDVLMAETQYAQKQLEYYQTVFEHNYALAFLQFLTKE